RIWQAAPITPFDAGCKHEYFIYSVARQTKDFFGKADNGAASPLPFREAQFNRYRGGGGYVDRQL
ncbi:MAG: hypothetical protein MKZ95_01825, partial [Pirellulales bacterium]|nr:hypothetical protein [Pirellulales bacterium]